MPIQGLTDLSKLGEVVEAGLPNITGKFVGGNQNGTVSGAFKRDGDSASSQQGTTYKEAQMSFDASLSNTTYGNSTTVQQEQIQYPYFIQVATGSETEDNIINEIELNNPFSLLDYKYSEYELNNLSWLRSNGQYNSKSTHPAVYELLLKIYNGTETKAGVSVKLHTENYTDEDFVINQDDETFRLAIKVKLASGKAVVGNGTILGLTDGTTNAGLTQSASVGLKTVSANYGNATGTTAGGSDLTSVGIGVTSDPTKSGIETSDSDLYLYYYVGETVQNANLINAGRIEEKVASLIPNNSSLIASYPIPDYENRITMSNGFIAPSNGWIVVRGWTQIAGTNCCVYVNGIEIGGMTSGGGQVTGATQIMVSAGDTITWNNGSAPSYFFPLKGDK